MTIAETPVDGDPSQRAYEELRGSAVARTPCGGRGLVILLREGLAAWLAQRGSGADALAVAPQRDQPASATRLSAEVHRDLVRVLASMVLDSHDKETTA